MLLVKPEAEIISKINGDRVMEFLELAGRTCHKSEGKITKGLAETFCSKILDRQHERVIEHQSISVQFVIDRGVSHELITETAATYSQESICCCNHKGGVTFVIPPWLYAITPGEYGTSYMGKRMEERRYNGEEHPTEADLWISAMWFAEEKYNALLAKGWDPQQARSVLPNSLKTEIVMTANLREWRHVFKLRTSKAAHPQIREVMVPLLVKFQKMLPVIFNGTNSDIETIRAPAVVVEQKARE